MTYDKNISPVGWYLGSYLLRFIELADKDRNEPDRRFVSWENTVLVKSPTIEEAYKKVAQIAKQNSHPYKGGSDGVKVQWEFLGITEIVPVYEKIVDGVEIAWSKRSPRKLKNLKQMVITKAKIRQ